LAKPAAVLRGQWDKVWRPLRRTAQATALLAFLACFLALRSSAIPPEITNSFMQLDPLAMLAAGLASRAVIDGSILAAVVLLLTLLFGRAWCGWICPLGTVLDIFAPQVGRKNQPAIPERWRAIKHILLIALLGSAVFGSLWLLWLDPIALLTRALAEGLWPALDHTVNALENLLYAAPALQPAVDAFDAAARPALLPDWPIYSSSGVLAALTLAVLIGLNFAAPRFWCRYLCPLGAGLGWLSKVAIFRRAVDSTACTDCAACARVCPTGTIRPERNNASDPAECTMCMKCVSACPRAGQRFAPRLNVAPSLEYDPGRRSFLIGAGLAAAGVALLRADASAWRDLPLAIQPPGGRDNDLFSKCLRCGDCVRACPTGAIHPAVWEAGLEGLGTPVLIPRLGFCRFDCNACGQVCPSGAIPPLDKKQKQKAVIGRAFVDKDRCLAWGDHVPCIICEEMCPVPNKAIRLEKVEFTRANGVAASLPAPVVDAARCIGCGTCEYKCPVNGLAAIRVYVPGRSEV
jgi:MauM/NapG family ferredoxin protein